MAGKRKATSQIQSRKGLDYRSPCDEAWYIVRLLKVEEGVLRVMYVNFPEDSDEWYISDQFENPGQIDELMARFRIPSEQMQETQCSEVVPGMVVVARHAFPTGELLYFDAVVNSVSRSKHKFDDATEEQVCTCQFRVTWKYGPAAGKHATLKVEDICLAKDLPVEDLVLNDFIGSARKSLEERMGNLADHRASPNPANVPELMGVKSSDRSHHHEMNREVLDIQPLTDLLQCPPARHKIVQVLDSPSKETKPRNPTTLIPYHERCAPFLKNLGFYHVSQMKFMKADVSMISALVERWRPETNTFHMPTGEITVTLQDVSCLLALPIIGYPVTGRTHDAFTWGMFIKDFLGVEDPKEVMLTRKPKGKAPSVTHEVGEEGIEEEEDEKKPSGHIISLTFLRKTFTGITAATSEIDVVQYTRAFLLNLCGSVLFPSTSQNGVPAYFLQFFIELVNPMPYNWGGAVLASLYYELTVASRPGRASFAGCSQLLMMWSWSHFAVFRPEIKETRENVIMWGRSDREWCPVLGQKWCRDPKKYKRSIHHCGVETARELFDRMKEGEVDWEPYVEYFDRLPMRVLCESVVWTIRMPLIYFWIVSYYYPDRVMRSFGLFQEIPPPPPLPWPRQDELQWITAANRDWAIEHRRYIDEYDRLSETASADTRPFDITTWPSYMSWFEREGMRTIYFHKYYDAFADQSRPAPSQPPAEIYYTQRGDVATREGARRMRDTILGIILTMKKGCRAAGKMLLCSSRASLEDFGQAHRFDEVLSSCGYSSIESIPDDEPDADHYVPPPPPVDDPRWQMFYDSEMRLQDLYDVETYNKYCKQMQAGQSSQQAVQSSQQAVQSSQPISESFDL